MRYVIIGAGAVGGTVAGLLAEAGHDVLVLARGAHAAALRADGLRLVLPTRAVQVPLAVTETVGELELRADDVLLLCTKGQDSGALLAVLAALPVGDATAGQRLPLVCVQNGVDNEVAALRRFATVIGVCVALPATHLQPGEVAALGGPLTALFEVGRYPGGVDHVVEQLCAALTAVGITSTPRADVMAWKRAKLLNNLANSLDALCGRELDAVASATLDELDRRARAEGHACFAAAGLTVVGDDVWAAHRGRRVQVQDVPGVQRGGSSSWQSLARGAGTVEADYLNGEVVLLGRLHGVPTPVNALLQARVGAAAVQHRPPGSTTPAALLAALR